MLTQRLEIVQVVLESDRPIVVGGEFRSSRSSLFQEQTLICRVQPFQNRLHVGRLTTWTTRKDHHERSFMANYPVEQLEVTPIHVAIRGEGRTISRRPSGCDCLPRRG